LNTSKNYNKNGANPENRHAVVLGGSLAGLLAARVLADHFEEVTLIERDVYLTNMEVEERRRKRQYFEIRRETDAQTGTRVAKVLMEVFNILAPPAVLFSRGCFRVL